MPIHITVDQSASWATHRWLAYNEPQITEQRKVQIFPVTKYNLLVSAFNISTILLVSAVAFTILFAYSAAVAIGSIAIFTRITTEKELKNYTLPNEPQALPAPALAPVPLAGNGAVPAPNIANRLWSRVRDAVSSTVLLRHVLNQAPQKEKEANIFQKLGVRRPENWQENEVFVFDYAVWKNKIPVPDAPI